MNDRIKELRKELGLTQEDFAKKIGIKRGAVANYEIGRNDPIDAVISLICREFNVSEEWLRHGTGPMFKPASAKLSTYLGEISSGDDYLIQDLIEVYMELDQASKDTLRNIADKMLEKRNERNQVK